MSELLGMQASSAVWRALLERADAPETFAEAALMAVVAREIVSTADYCKLVGSAAEAIPWLAAGCRP